MNNLWRESKKNKFYLEKLLSTFYTYYLELSETKPYGIDYSFDRIAKDYRLLEIINNREEFFVTSSRICCLFWNPNAKITSQINSWIL